MPKNANFDTTIRAYSFGTSRFLLLYRDFFWLLRFLLVATVFFWSIRIHTYKSVYHNVLVICFTLNDYKILPVFITQGAFLLVRGTIMNFRNNAP